jgi:hypothetical protein
MAADLKLMEGANKQQSDYVWQDQELRFDSRPIMLACRKGETIIGQLAVLIYNLFVSTMILD